MVSPKTAAECYDQVLFLSCSTHPKLERIFALLFLSLCSLLATTFVIEERMYYAPSPSMYRSVSGLSRSIPD
ncbi:hypothetical protein CEXT_443231 [Caerostris extrusa]|uniref:Uncharacterized protein n=1 Tax=Caerostris extrusa TaxID=172846 RepID=A0AAV4RA68_CAEEX|nr:hypothetical protein CEXT_443231 [Caerostris extrusa]